jgi:polyferredoxin/tetratricopeptide (TPR) repeat protein
MSEPSHANSARCTHASLAQRGPLSLPILADHGPKGQIRKSKSGKRRAIILASIQLLIIIHIALWYFGAFGGKTLTPVEPSESMEFAKHGVINAGLIFFAIALLGTLIFGRWFCGWGCHIVMLQDFCGWIMKKCGVRPKVFRSRFLIYVPLLLAIYMFIMPAVHRWGLIPLDAKLATSLGADNWLVQSLRVSMSWIGFPLPYTHLPEWKVQSHLTTTDFWRTFAHWMVAIPFLFVCGFATVYFLGAKGFCTYGCPYGGFFAPLDKFAFGRILVTDACEGCGHCTAVCTSNVRVHEEVREYGMVVNPGCMKCMDCVSVCPNDALYFGFAKPAVMKGPAKNQAPKRIYDLTLGEEFAFAAVFALTFVSVRGVYGWVPMLMAAGLAGIVTFLAWKAWRLVRDQNVALYRFQLKLKGAMRPAGWTFAALTAGVVLLTVHSGVVNGAMSLAGRHDAKVTVPPDAAYDPHGPTISPEMTASADRALRLYSVASGLRDGGIGLPLWGDWQTTIDVKAARLHLAKRDFTAAERVVRRSIEREGAQDTLCSGLAWVLFAQGRADEALRYGESIIAQHGEFAQTADAYVRIAMSKGETALAEKTLRAMLERNGPDDRFSSSLMRVCAAQNRAAEALSYGRGVLLEHRNFDATLEAFVQIAGAVHDTQMIIDLCRQRLEKFPDHLNTLRWLSIVLVQTGAADEGIALTRRTIELDPNNAQAYLFLSGALADEARMDEAIETLRGAVTRFPANARLHGLLADMLEFTGRLDEAKAHRERANQLQQGHHQPAHNK